MSDAKFLITVPESDAPGLRQPPARGTIPMLHYGYHGYLIRDIREVPAQPGKAIRAVLAEYARIKQSAALYPNAANAAALIAAQRIVRLLGYEDIT